MEGIPIIQLENITVYTDNNELVLKNVFMEIEKGSINYILGKSGVGKTTLLKIISGELFPSNGYVFINSKERQLRNTKDILKYRRQIGYIFQDFQLINSMNVFDNIAYPLKIENVSKEARKKKVTELAELLDITDILYSSVSSISGGEQQRVSIARAIIKQPQLILADEPTGNLDPKKSLDVMNLLETLALKLGITTIIVTHDYSLFTYNEDRKRNFFQISNCNLYEISLEKSVKFVENE